SLQLIKSLIPDNPDQNLVHCILRYLENQDTFNIFRAVAQVPKIDPPSLRRIDKVARPPLDPVHQWKIPTTPALIIRCRETHPVPDAIADQGSAPRTERCDHHLPFTSRSSPLVHHFENPAKWMN